jgi:hypothetical protein
VSTIGTTTDLNRFTGTWTLDPQKTSIAFRTKAMWIFTVNGTAKALSGHAAISPDGRATGALIIDAASLTATGRAPPPQAGPVRGPDPLRQGHRAAEPAAEGLRPEPALVRGRGPGLRRAGLDADARPGRGRPPLGTEAAPPAALRRRRPRRPQRPAAAAPPRRTLALGRGHHRRHHPHASHSKRLTSRNNPATRKEPTPGPMEPRPARATAGQPGTARTENQPGPNTSGRQITHAKDRG